MCVCIVQTMLTHNYNYISSSPFHSPPLSPFSLSCFPTCTTMHQQACSTSSQRPSDSHSVTCSPGPRRLVHRVTEYPGTTVLPGQSDATLPLAAAAAATKPSIAPAHVSISRPAGRTAQDKTNQLVGGIKLKGEK